MSTFVKTPGFYAGYKYKYRTLVTAKKFTINNFKIVPVKFIEFLFIISFSVNLTKRLPAAYLVQVVI